MRSDPSMLDQLLKQRHIQTNLHARSLRDAIPRLVDFMIAAHPLPGVDRDRLIQSVCEREADMSTCVGSGLAVPHGELPEGEPMVGVMGIVREGIPCITPDGDRLHCVVLLATPPKERNRHLEVLAELARVIKRDDLRSAIYRARSPAEVYRLLRGEQHGFAVDGA